jgi:hypothetical protein
VGVMKAMGYATGVGMMQAYGQVTGKPLTGLFRNEYRRRPDTRR